MPRVGPALLSAWLIVDTGSTDRTKQVVEDALRGIPGEVVSRPWKNFGANRSESRSSLATAQSSRWSSMQTTRWSTNLDTPFRR